MREFYMLFSHLSRTHVGHGALKTVTLGTSFLGNRPFSPWLNIFLEINSVVWLFWSDWLFPNYNSPSSCKNVEKLQQRQNLNRTNTQLHLCASKIHSSWAWVGSSHKGLAGGRSWIRNGTSSTGYGCRMQNSSDHNRVHHSIKGRGTFIRTPPEL